MLPLTYRQKASSFLWPTELPLMGFYWPSGLILSASLPFCIPCSSCKTSLTSSCLRDLIFSEIPILLSAQVTNHLGSEQFSHPFRSLTDSSSPDSGLGNSLAHVTWNWILILDNIVFPIRLWAVQVWGLCLVFGYTTRPGMMPGTE